MKTAVLVALSWMVAATVCWQGPASGASSAAVEYPTGYRAWTHIKSTLLGPDSPRAGVDGGFQHIYANAEAVAGYRSRNFPEGSVIVFDWLAMTEHQGLYLEGSRRQVDVMHKDSLRFQATGGWGFQRFVGDSRTELASKPAPSQCFGCHQRRQRDGLVLSRIRD